MRRQVSRSLLAAAIVGSVVGCGGGGDGGTTVPEGNPVTAYRTLTVPPGPQCAEGGVQVDMGVDVDKNGTLDASEIDSTEYVCNGLGLAVAITVEPSGINCATGGLRLDTGSDVNGNGMLDAGEATLTRYVCNGGVGPATLVRATVLPTLDANCPAGGYLIASGVDDSRNGVLEDAEVDASQYLCHGQEGAAGTAALVDVLAEPVGGACPDGGVAVRSGQDADADGLLDAGEVATVRYVCNGAGATAPTAVTTSPIVLAANNEVVFTGTIDTGDRRLPDGTRGVFYTVTLPAGVADFSAIPSGAVEFHLFTDACLAEADLEDWAPCFVASVPRVRVPAGSYVVMVKATETSYLWGSTDYEAILRFTPGVAIGPATIAQHVQAGLDAIVAGGHSAKTDDFLQALAHFDAAVALIGVETGAAQADVDRARFFGGIARVAALMDPYSDLIPNNGLSDLGDLLDGFGLVGTDFQRGDLANGLPSSIMDYTWETRCDYYGCREVRVETPKPFSPDSPRAQEIQAFLRDRLAAELTAALALLDQVPSTLAAQIVDGAQVTEIDYTDALIARAVAHGMLAFIRVQQAYDLDLDLDALRTNLEIQDPQGNAAYAPQDFLDENPFFGRLRSATSLPAARNDAIAALQTYQAALTALKAEADPQADDLFFESRQSCVCDMYGCTCTTVYNPPADIDKEIADLDAPLAALQAAGAYTFDNGTPADTSDDVTVNASAFFAGVDLRALAPPVGAGLNGDRFGFFPDTTFGGVLVSSNVDWTTDFDADGAPDSFFPEFEAFFPAYFASATFNSSTWLSGYSTTMSITFASSGDRFLGTVTIATPTPTTTPVAGTFAFQGTQLTLVFDVALPNAVKTVVVDANRIVRDSVDGYSQFYDGSGYWVGSNWTYWTRF